MATIYYSPAMLACFDIFDEEEQETVRRAEVEDMLSGLEGDEREVLCLRYGIGLEDNHPRSLREVAALMNCSHERIRSIESSALVKITGAGAGSSLKRKP